MFADRSPMSSHAVLAGARTGDVVLYAGAQIRPSSATNTPQPTRKRERSIPTVFGANSKSKENDNVTVTGCFSLSAFLSMLPPAIACSDGARDASVSMDCVAIVVESNDDDEPNLLIYDSDDVLVTLPLSCLTNRPACLRPLLTARSSGSEKHALAQRQAVHRLLKAAVDDICCDRLMKSTQTETMQSQTYLAGYLLWRAGVLAPNPAEFRAYSTTPNDAEIMFGAEASILDVNLKQEYAYGNQIWLS